MSASSSHCRKHTKVFANFLEQCCYVLLFCMHIAVCYIFLFQLIMTSNIWYLHFDKILKCALVAVVILLRIMYCQIDIFSIWNIRFINFDFFLTWLFLRNCFYVHWVSFENDSSKDLDSFVIFSYLYFFSSAFDSFIH